MSVPLKSADSMATSQQTHLTDENGKLPLWIKVGRCT